MIDCLFDYIGLLNVSTSKSGIYINRLQGIDTPQFELIRDSETYDASDAWDDIQNRAIDQFEQRLLTWSAKYYRNRSYIQSVVTGQYRTPETVVIPPKSLPDNWTLQNASDGETWNSIAYGNDLFVAVGSNSGLMTSPDGIIWTNRTPPTNATWNDVAFGNGIFVAVSQSGVVMRSTDGLTWSAGTPSSASLWDAVTYGNGLFVAVSSGGGEAVMTSPDGQTWTGRIATLTFWDSIAFGNGLFVATGAAVIMTSPDGITWTDQTPPQISGWTGISFGNGLFVGVSSGGAQRVMTSSDGINWTLRNAVESNIWVEVAFGNGLFVALSIDGTNRIMTSSDGITWTANTAPAQYQWRSIGYGNEIFVGGASTGMAGETDRIMRNEFVANNYAGWLFNDFALYEKNMKLVIPSIDLYTTNATSSTIRIFDAVTGDLLDSISFSTSIGHNNIVINKSYKLYQYTKIFICYDESEVETIKMTDLPLYYNRNYVSTFNVTQQRISKSVEIKSENMSSVGTTGQGMIVKYNIDCSLDNFVCQRLNLFSSPFQYLLGYEFCQERLFSDRINQYTLLDRGRAQELADIFLERFNQEIDSILDAIVLDEWDFCWQCDREINYKPLIP